MKKIIDLFRKKPDYNRPASTPEERVKLFISHWHEQWKTAKKKMGKEVDFDLWDHLVSEVDEAHFIKGSGSGTKTSFSSVADFDPNVVKFAECDISNNSAQVYTERHNQPLTTYHVYELHRNEENNWLISEISTLFRPPKHLVIETAKHSELLGMGDPNSPFINCQENLNLNENTLFQGNRSINIPPIKDGQANITTVGKLHLKSGVIGILDFGYDFDDFEPLHRKVEPGEYVVETVSVHDQINDRIAGIRIRFSDHETPVKWYAANTPSGNGVYGVDAGNLAVFDVNSLFGLTRIEKEKIFSKWALSNQPQLLSMTGKNDCFITSSGCGDGAYPAFWGVNEDEKVVSLYLDFMMLVQVENGICVSA